MLGGRPEAGLLLGGRYRLAAPIAAGGMAQVWRATDEVLRRDVAVKVLHAELAADEAFRARFRQEARNAASLTHPGVALVHDYAEQEQPDGLLAYLVMELVPGETLGALLARTGRLPARQVLQLVAQVSDVLRAAHSTGLVHRDIKPANLILTPHDGVKVTDFGIARAAADASLTRTGELIGSAHYLAPEQVTGRPATPASDVYALGVVAYQCLAGRRPFSGDNQMAIALARLRDTPPPLPADVSPHVAALVWAMLAPDPAARPTDADVAQRARRLLADPTLDYPVRDAGELHSALGPAAIPLAPAAWPDHTRRLRRALRGPRWLLPAAAVAVVLLLGLTALAASRSGPPAEASAPPSATPTNRSPAPVVNLVARAYVGRPYTEARAALLRLGLRVEGVFLAGAGSTGTVVGVSPTGPVPLGTPVTLTVRPAPAPPVVQPGDGATGGDNGKGRGKDEKGKGKHDD